MNNLFILIFFFIILNIILCLIKKKEYFKNNYISKNIILNEFVINPYTLNCDEFILNKLKNVTNKIPIKIVIDNQFIQLYNNFIKNKYDMIILQNRLIEKNLKNYKIISNIDYTYIYFIVKHNSDIKSFYDCKNKKILILGNKFTKNLLIDILKLLKIYENVELKLMNNENLLDEFYYNNKYDAIFLENYYYDKIDYYGINKNYFKNKSIKIITGNNIINGKNELNKIIDLLKYSIHVDTVKKKSLVIDNYDTLVINKTEEIFIALPFSLVCKKNLNKNYVKYLFKLLFKYNFNNIDNIEYIDKNMHNGSLELLFEKNIINNKNYLL